ncbi:MAG: DUF3562 domain-containing protein [Pseudomonadota bacterium]
MNPNSDTPDIPDQTLAQYRDAGERLRAHREIEAIARELARPAAEIADVYTELYADLKARARVTDYVRVFAARKIRARYQHGRPDTS